MRVAQRGAAAAGPITTRSDALAGKLEPPLPMMAVVMTTLIAVADVAGQPRVPLPCRHRGRLARRRASAVIIIGSLLMLLVHLGTYAPWDDEAITAMTARAVWRTGDTSARVDGHNLLVYRDGLLVRDFKDRFTPPLQFFLLAPIIGLLGDGNWAIRLPSAFCGAATVAIMLRWMWRALPPRRLLWWAAAAAVLTNYELFLFCRQCRYYGLAIALTTAAAYLYTFRSGRTRGALGLGVVLAALLATHYLDWAAAVACLCVDYAIWGRRRQRFTWPQWAVLVGPSLVAGAIVCPIWNPLARSAAATPVVGDSYGWVGGHLWLLWLNGRDLIASGFAILPLVLACPLLYLKRRSPWLLRGPLALAVYVGVITAAAATPLRDMERAEVRYLAPVLPVCIGVAVTAVWATLSLRPGPRAALLTASAAMVMVGTSFGPGGPAVTSDPVAFWVELARPQAEPYTPTIAWVNGHVPAGASVYVEPAWMAYPLMFRAPGPTYAWQLADPPRADLASAPPIHFRGRVAPDYLIRFGTGEQSIRMTTAMADLAAKGERYEPVATIPVHWQDTYRPERVWRTFTTVVPSPGNEVYVWRRVGK